ncbi:hypothetical protein S40293_11505 [Stachybotrys chartarum IBT 40293]|nr:hypothetical protein S40293_11505 [Stachybotrys chartarum IBT 40293]
MDTLIPLFFLELNPAQAAIDEGVEMLSLSIKRFEGAAKDLLDQHANCANLQEVIRAFVRGCQHGCTGNLNWSLGSVNGRPWRRVMRGDVHDPVDSLHLDKVSTAVLVRVAVVGDVVVAARLRVQLQPAVAATRHGRLGVQLAARAGVRAVRLAAEGSTEDAPEDEIQHGLEDGAGRNNEGDAGPDATMREMPGWTILRCMDWVTE